jgi:hypothetical protein
VQEEPDEGVPVSEHNAFRDEHVHVCEDMCSTCIFRPGNLMDLRRGRVPQMIDEAVADEASIPCHKTLGGDTAVCRGFFDRMETLPLRLAVALDIVRFVDPE